MKKICIFILFTLISVLIIAQNPDSLFIQYQKLKEQGQTTEAINTLHKLVNYWLDIDPLLSSQYAAMANQLASQTQDSLLIALTLNDIGLSYLAQKTYFMATEAFFKAYDIYQKFNDKKNLAYTLIFIGKAYLEQGIADIAEAKFKNAKQIFEQINDDFGIALSLEYLGLSNLRRDEQLAIDYLQQAIKILSKLNNLESLAHKKLILAEAFYQIGENDSSITYSLQALKYFEKQKKLNEIAKTYLLLAKNYYDLEQYRKSYGYGLRALKIFSKIKNYAKLADIYYLFAQIHREKNRIDSSINYALKSVQIAETYGLLEILSKDYELLASAYANKKNYELAFQYQTLYAQTLVRLFENVKQQHFSSFQMNLETENKEKQIQLLKIQAEKESITKDKELYRRTAIFSTIIILLVLFFGIILIIRYREKVKTSKLLASTNTQLIQEIEIRKQTEQKFRDSEERYRLLFRKTPVGIFQIDENLVITDVNDRFASILHLHREDIINQPLDKFLDRNLLRTIKNALDNNKEILDEQSEILTKHGIAYIKISVKPFKYIKDDRPVKSAIIIVQDITEHKRTEQLYEKNVKLKQKLIDLLPDSLILVNEYGKILDTHLPHLPEMENRANHITDIVSHSTADLILNELDIALNKKKIRKFFFTNSKGHKLLARIIPDQKTSNALIIITLLPKSVLQSENKTYFLNNELQVHNSKYKALKDIENEIENNLIPMYQNLQRALSFIMIKTFIDRINSMSQKYQLSDLKKYASQLQAALEEFDVIKVTEIISQFPNLVNKYIDYNTITF